MSDWYVSGFVILLSVFLIWAAVAWNQPRALMRSAQLEVWVPQYEGTADRFYALMYERLQSDLADSALPFATLSFGPRQLFASRHIFSARPVYLEVRYEHLSYFIYALPAPQGLHVSSWLFSKHEAWLNHPLLKYLVAWKLTQMTLFQYDIMRLFHVVIENSLGAVIDELLAEKGLPPLEDFERRPVLSGFYASMQLGTGPGGTPMISPLTGQTRRVNSSPIHRTTPTGRSTPSAANGPIASAPITMGPTVDPGYGGLGYEVPEYESPEYEVPESEVHAQEGGKHGTPWQEVPDHEVAENGDADRT